MAELATTRRIDRPARRAAIAALHVLSRLAGAARFFVGAGRVHKKAQCVLVLACLPATLWGATPPGTTLTNTASAHYSIAGVPRSQSATVSVVTDATIRFMAAVANGAGGNAGNLTAVGASQCSSSGSTSGPFDLDGGLAADNLLLTPAKSFSAGQAVYVEVVDHWMNKDAAQVESVAVKIASNTLPADSETLLLTETGPDTGVFVGAIKSTRQAATHNNCLLSAAGNTRISADYTYQHDISSASTTTATTAALVDPFGIVFDSVNGLPENGATVTLINAATGLPAAVLCDDGITQSPNPVVSGSTFTACGATVTMAAGAFRFPLINPGKYYFQVSPPSGYDFPSAQSKAALAAAPPTAAYDPFIIPASYGAIFEVLAGDPALHVDIPIDPDAGRDLQIAKSAGKTVAGEGEYVPYALTVTNENTAAAVANVQIADRLPQGFRYQAGSARLQGVALTDPIISADGRTLTFVLGAIAAGAEVTLRYVAQVGAGAPTGQAENVAAAVASANFGGVQAPVPVSTLTSNTARASVLVREDLMRSRAILAGRVIIGSCDGRANNDKAGLQNARIMLEDGTYVLTDQEGRWHADNIRPGTHVVQLDLDSLGADYEVMDCADGGRFAGRKYSQFVNLRGGSLWRTDFHVQKKAPREMRLTQRLSVQRAGSLAQVRLELRGEGDVRQVSSTLMLSEGVGFVADSARIDGDATDALEHSDGFLVMRLKEQQGAWSRVFTFELAATEAAPLKLVGMTRFNAPSASQGISLPRIEVQAEMAQAAGQAAAAETFAIIPQPVPHHEIPNAPGAQYRGERTVRIEGDATPQPQKYDSRSQLVEQLPYDAAWLASAAPGEEWLHPQERFLPALPTIKAAVKLRPGQRATLRLNGEEVSPLYFDGEESNAAGTVKLGTWRGIHIKDGDNALELVVTERDGREVLRQQRNIHYSVTPDRVELVPEHSRLVADGKTRPILALRFYDKDGYKMRRGVNGEFLLNSPYESMNQLEANQRDPLGGKINGKPRYEIGSDGIALVELAPTTQSGDAVLNFTFGQGRKQELRAWLEAGQRDWVLVGFGQGTLGHKRLSGNMTALQEADADGELFDGDRLALYAKGTVKGDFLLTLAYDSAKRQGKDAANLKQAIDPTRYYTLYADASQPYFDAASARKLYLKLERRQFYALFGDYDTGLTVTEFSRYSRTVNGLKSEYKGERGGYNAFATTTEQAYIKDEIAGDGTSGLYRLSRRNIVQNSDKIRIETRDRFRSEVVVEARTLSRHLDYDIDYANGTLFFKQPVNARDAAFNPVYIVAEYESGDPRDNRVTAGGRASYKPTGGMELGATLVHDGTQGAGGDLAGFDAVWQYDDKTRLAAELAQSQRELSGLKQDGTAWKLEASRHDDGLDARVYLREQQAGFGLGQQAGGESGTRKIGGEARMSITDSAQGQVQAFREEYTGVALSSRNVLEGRVNHNLGELTGYYGGRYAADTDSAGMERKSEQAMAGASYAVDKKLTLRAAGETGVGGTDNNNYLDRANLGADYLLTEQTKLFVEQEYARGSSLATDTTRIGLSAQPWTGGAMAASLGNQSSLDSGRMYANLGLVQRWQINEYWQADAGLDRAQTLRSSSALPLNPNVAPAFGSSGGDYTAGSLGVNYNDRIWGANTRVERRLSATETKLNFLAGLQHNLDAGRVLASGITYTATQSAIARQRSASLMGSYASRPWDSDWMWLDRLVYTDEVSDNLSASSHGSKLVNNFNANWQADGRTQLALQYGAKYVFDTINGESYRGYTDLIGAELRRNLGRAWDVGVHASVLHSWNGGMRQYGTGASVGYLLLDNAWLVAGYNLKGYGDTDFSGAAYRAQGPYVSLRMKFDQDTLRLNENTGTTSRHR